MNVKNVQAAGARSSKVGFPNLPQMVSHRGEMRSRAKREAGSGAEGLWETYLPGPKRSRACAVQSRSGGALPDGSGRPALQQRDCTKVPVVPLISTRKTFDRMNKMDRISRGQPELWTHSLPLLRSVWLLRSRSVGLAAFAFGESFSPLPEWFKSKGTIIYDNSTNLHSGNCDRMNRMDRMRGKLAEGRLGERRASRRVGTPALQRTGLHESSRSSPNLHSKNF